MLAKIASEFEAAKPKRRRGGRRRGRPVESDAAPAFDIVEKLHWMLLPERYRRNPPRARPAPEPTTADDDSPPEPDFDTEDDLDEELSDAEFYQSLRQDISALQAGTVSSNADTEHKVRQMRPWSKKRHPRDRYGNRLY